MPDAPFGFLNVDKPLNLTSHNVVSRVRRVFGIKKVGHAGTLDPLATGVLVVCVGPATRLSEYVMHQTKAYRAKVTLGLTTTTDDAEGDVLAAHDPSLITREQVEAVLPQFTGNIEQLPPLYSAIKQRGRKLYELMREGKADTIERKPRAVRVDEITLTEWTPPEVTIEVTCGSGTYIRSLARDIGALLGVGAYLSGLVRTRSGVFDVSHAVSLDALAESDAPQSYLIPPHKALAGYPTIMLTDAHVDDIVHGRATAITDADDGTLAFGYDSHHQFIAILVARRGQWHPHKVFSDVSSAS